MNKTKEGILEKHLPTPDSDDTDSILSAMDEYADLVAVAFAEWNDSEKFLYCYMGEGVYKYIHAKLGAFIPSDLYQYWIEKVYNK